MSAESVPVHIVLLAGGQGLRAVASGDTPKQFRTTGRGPLFRVSLDAFIAADKAGACRVESVTVTVPSGWRERAGPMVADLAVPVHLAEAGPTRTASTWRALGALAEASEPSAPDLVAVHDAARPFATADLLQRVAAAAAQQGGAVPGVPVPDTIIEGGDGPVRYLPRENLLAVQTPQVFRWDLLHAAHLWAAGHHRSFSDDGGLLAARGHVPAVVAGEPDNWKVTSDADWFRADVLLSG